MKIDKIVLRKVDIPLKAPFETSFAAMTAKNASLLRFMAKGKLVMENAQHLNSLYTTKSL